MIKVITIWFKIAIESIFYSIDKHSTFQITQIRIAKASTHALTFE